MNKKSTDHLFTVHFVAQDTCESNLPGQQVLGAVLVRLATQCISPAAGLECCGGCWPVSGGETWPGSAQTKDSSA